MILIIENLLNSALFTLTPWRGLGNYALVKYSKRKILREKKNVSVMC